MPPAVPVARPRAPLAALASLDELVARADLAAPHELAVLFDDCAQQLGTRGCTAYVADLQQDVLQPLLLPWSPAGPDLVPLGVDGTLAGRAYQLCEPQLQADDAYGSRIWLPLRAGTERLGVLAVSLETPGVTDEQSTALARLAATAGLLIAAKTPYGDTLVSLRRRSQLGVAAELHYSVLPPLTFTGREVSVAAALEPCYEVAGDAVDYAVDPGRTQVAVFDGMGHGLHSAQCAVFTMAAYRSARRSGLGLIETLEAIDEALFSGLGGEIFSTAVLVDLDTRNGLLQWVNAGHPPPLLLRGGRLIRALESEPQPPLGLGNLLDGAGVDVGREQLEPGDLVLLYTDGVVEARSPEGEFFGVERLADLVIRHLAGGLSPAETLRRVVRELLAHHGDQLTDDATLLVLEWRSVED
ncbi:MAG: Serine phosphatase RsbU, regulator of sigma subunit [Frankiales bacterium]|jgi:hypothetical protein|nr:Serine phosphatase RsbU, regulator of sigma subunit [Frankiales bacterium]